MHASLTKMSRCENKISINNLLECTSGLTFTIQLMLVSRGYIPADLPRIPSLEAEMFSLMSVVSKKRTRSLSSRMMFGVL